MLNSVLTWLLKKRKIQRELFLKYPLETQNEVLSGLLERARNTEFGKTHGFGDVKRHEQFKRNVPLSAHDQLRPYIDRMMKGEPDVLWHGAVKWFARSSGTTSDRSKFIPITNESLEDCHFKGGKDMLSIYCHNHPDTKIFSGKGLSVGGSHQVEQFNQRTFYGDLSAVLIENLPLWAELYRTPKREVALMSEWESKLTEMTRVTLSQDITNMQGVPSWTLILLQRVLERSGKDTILDVWPNLEVFFHGAVSFVPYREQFGKLMGERDIRYMETYNASEGFFAMQDIPQDQAMLLMLDYGIYYEFIPREEWGREDAKTLGLDQVQVGEDYEMVISTNGGLWRYRIGDTIVFTSTDPHRIRITGRTKHFINAFGEELMIDNAERALKTACRATGASISDYTAGPVYLKDGDRGLHQWLIEFVKEPDDSEQFVRELDAALQKLNSDYEAKRHKDMILKFPDLIVLPEGTFYRWMKKRGKLGGQHKVPRLANDRKYLDDILRLISG